MPTPTPRGRPLATDPPTRPGRRSAEPNGPATGRQRSLEDEQASQMLLAFARLLRGPRHGNAFPKPVQALLESGYLAPRHLAAFALVALDGPLTVSELADREGLALSTASLLVTQLSEAGLVERHEDTSDRRRTVVSVAPQFRRASEAVLESKLAPLRRAIVRMGSQRAKALLEGLSILIEEATTAAEAGTAGSRGAAAARETKEVTR